MSQSIESVLKEAFNEYKASEVLHVAVAPSYAAKAPSRGNSHISAEQGAVLDAETNTGRWSDLNRCHVSNRDTQSVVSFTWLRHTINGTMNMWLPDFWQPEQVPAEEVPW